MLNVNYSSSRKGKIYFVSSYHKCGGVSCSDLDLSPHQSLLGCKKSKLKSLKSRLFGRSKKTVAERNAKLSQSASDITAEKGLGSDEDLV